MADNISNLVFRKHRCTADIRVSGAFMSHVGVSEPVRSTKGLRCPFGLEYGKRGVKGVCKGTE